MYTNEDFINAYNRGVTTREDPFMSLELERNSLRVFVE